MSFSQLNLQKNYLNCQELSWMPQKSANCTTAQEKGSMKHNQPIFLDGIFWNANHNLPWPEKNHSFVQLDRSFEGELLREHVAAIKFSIEGFLSTTTGQENQFSQTECKNQGTYSFSEQQLFREPDRAIDQFINNLKDSKVFKEHEATNLQALLKERTLALRLFEVFGEACPSFLKQNLNYLIYRGLLLDQQIKNKNFFINQELLSFLESNFQQLIGNTLTNQTQSFKKLALAVVYTVIESVNGKARNKYFEDIQFTHSNYSKFNLTKFQKSLNAITKQKSKKKTFILRRSFNNQQTNILSRKKRHLSNNI